MIKGTFDLFLTLGAGWVLWLLLACSLIAVSVFLNRWKELRNQERVGFLLWNKKFSCWLDLGLPQEWKTEAPLYFENYPCVESKTLLWLSKQDEGAQVEKRLLSRLQMEQLSLEKYLSILGTLGNAAPFIGLLGTVLGIIKAFVEISHSDLSSQGNGILSMSGGLGEALVTTAAGLLIAIPCVMAYNFYQRKMKAILNRTQSLAGFVLGS